MQWEVQMGEYKGDVGTIYTKQADDVDEDDKRWEAWFEDFHIIGLGHTELEALEDAAQMTAKMNTLVLQVITAIRAGDVHHAAGSGD